MHYSQHSLAFTLHVYDTNKRVNKDKYFVLYVYSIELCTLFTHKYFFCAIRFENISPRYLSTQYTIIGRGFTLSTGITL